MAEAASAAEAAVAVSNAINASMNTTRSYVLKVLILPVNLSGRISFLRKYAILAYLS